MSIDQMKMTEVCQIKTGFREADFWIVASGREIGAVIKRYDPAYIGVKVLRTDRLLPEYLYYYMMYQCGQGLYRGQTRLAPSFFDRIVFSEGGA